MKKVISIIIVFIMLFTMVACNNDETTSSDIVSGTTENTSSQSDNSSAITGGPVKHGSNVNFTDEGEQGETVIDKSQIDKYVPSCVTLTMYNQDSYGITWNTEKNSNASVVQICEGNKFASSKARSFKSDTKAYSTTLAGSGNPQEYYVHKAVLSGLIVGKTYTYRCYDTRAKVSSEEFTFTVKNRKSDTFTFVHVTDSQSGADTSIDPSNTGLDTGKPFSKTLEGVVKSGANPDFFLHSGDIVEWSAYESYWKYMLNYNKKFFATIPFMAISGNHEVSYQAGKYETFKHFNYELPQQETEHGIFYSFEYGNAKFVMIDTNKLKADKLRENQYNWLVNELKSNKKKWLIVAMHNPMYSPGVYGSESGKNGLSLSLQKQLTDVFAQNKVDIVLQGHDHVLSKTYPIGVGGVINSDINYEIINGIKYSTNNNGVIYLMNSTSGNQARWVASDANLDYFEEYNQGIANSWAEIEVSESLLTIKVYNSANGTPELWKSYGIKK